MVKYIFNAKQQISLNINEMNYTIRPYAKRPDERSFAKLKFNHLYMGGTGVYA